MVGLHGLQQIAALCVVLGGAVGHAWAQEALRYGLSAGGNLSSYVALDRHQTSSVPRVGGQVEAFATLRLWRGLYCQPELGFSLHRSLVTPSAGQTVGEEVLTTAAIGLPVLFLWGVGLGSGTLWCGGGPYVSWGFRAELGGADQYADPYTPRPQHMHAWDVGVKALVAYEFSFRMRLGLTAQLGFLDQNPPHYIGGGAHRALFAAIGVEGGYVF